MDNDLKNSILKTGTVTIGIVCKDGIVIATDRRQSYGGSGGVSYVAGKAKKIHELNERMIVTTAGGASDSRRSISLIRAEIRLKELKSRKKISVSETASLLSNMLFHNIRQPSMIPSIAHFLLAGYDEKGFHLYDASPDGYLQEIKDYASNGSGMLQAHAVLDSEFKENMSTEDGVKLAVKCIMASAGRDPAVGGGLDVYVVKKNEVKEIMAKAIMEKLEDKKIN